MPPSTPAPMSLVTMTVTTATTTTTTSANPTLTRVSNPAARLQGPVRPIPAGPVAAVGHLAPQSQPTEDAARLHHHLPHGLDNHDHHDGLDPDIDSHSDTAPAADAPHLATSHRASNSATPPLSPTPHPTDTLRPHSRQNSSQPLFDLPAHSSATRPPPSPDMTAVPAAKPARHPAILPLLDANSLHRTRSLEATLGQSQSRSALAGMPAVKFESQLSSQGLSPLPYSTRAKTRNGQFPPPSPTTPTSSAQFRSTRMRSGFPLESPLPKVPPPGAAASDEQVSSPTSPTNGQYPQDDDSHAHDQYPSSIPSSMYNEPLHRQRNSDADNNQSDDVDMRFPVSQRSPSPLPYAGPVEPAHTSSDLSSDHQQHYPMSPFAQPPGSSAFAQHPYTAAPTPVHRVPLTRHRSRGLESAMGDMELDTDMDVDSRHSTPAPEVGDHDNQDQDRDHQSPFGRHHDAYAMHHHQHFNTQLPVGYAHAHAHANDDMEHDHEAMDLMDLVPGPSTAHFASRTPFQRRGRQASSTLAFPPPTTTNSSSVRDLSTAPPTSSRSGSPTGSRTSGTHATSASAGGMPVLIPSTTKKSHTNCRSLPAVLEYPDYLIPIDAPIQSKRGGAPAAAAAAAATGRVTRARARNSAPATTSAGVVADTQVPTAHADRDGGSGSSSPAQPANPRKRKRVSAPSTAAASTTPSSSSASASASASAAALAFHAPPFPNVPATPAAAAPRAAAAATPASAYDDAHFDEDEAAMDLDGLDPREAKRIRNTISARRSRARKAAKIEFLERRVNDLESDADRLRADNDQLRELLVRHGIAVPPPPIAGGRGVDAMDEE
ncbi:hypothetical protein BCR44DRAFT_1423162 [Catenaria anguillulae PL171]|uniref:BZIP domain-containing protein n=1 Tax=Catenaria anguillulae PL171 TaxID=765915 RepID=A0A1Y2I415_9FUNG|nr:hypothetical protein BCR44DRAFT_1423162 [Catenaria anguillulae PL171]